MSINYNNCILQQLTVSKYCSFPIKFYWKLDFTQNMKYMFISVSLSNEHFMVLVKTDGYYTLYWVIVVKLDTPKLDRCRILKT